VPRRARRDDERGIEERANVLEEMAEVQDLKEEAAKDMVRQGVYSDEAEC